MKTTGGIDWRALVPVLFSAAVLLAGNGLLSTVIALRGRTEGFSESTIGIFGAAYFLGFLLSSWGSIHLIRRAGHIRVFAGLAAAAAVAVLCMLMWIESEVWTAARLVQGFAFSGITTVLESWLNGMTGNKSRGRLLSIYRVVDLAAVTGGQYLLPVVGIDDFRIFVVCAVFFCIALIPVSLSNLRSPDVPAGVKFDIRAVWAMSPVACAGCVAVGMANSAFRNIGPAYALEVGLDVTEVATFMSLFIIAGAFSQFPIGWLSDRFDRRTIIMVATVGASGASLSAALLSDTHPYALFASIAMFGAFALPLYSLSSAHANDHCPEGKFVTLASGLLLFFAAGAIIGSPSSALLMEFFGPDAFFMFICGVHGAFLLFVLYRRTRRAAIPKHLRSRFVGMMRTSPALFALTQHQRAKHKDDTD
jgi:MFS family permease